MSLRAQEYYHVCQKNGPLMSLILLIKEIQGLRVKHICLIYSFKKWMFRKKKGG